MTDERRVITKESIKAEMLGNLTFPLIVNIFATLCYCGWIALSLVLKNACFDAYISIVGVAAVVLFVLADVLLFLEVAVEWYMLIRIVYVAKKGIFEIVEDKLERIAEHELWESDYFIERLLNRLLGRFRRRYENVFYFSKYGRVPGYSESAMIGEKFYLVIIPSENNKVVRTYSAKFYRYEK